MPTTTHIALILLAIASFPAVAENWRTVAANAEQRIEIDTATLLRNDDGSVRAWEKDTFAKPHQAVPGDFYFKSAKSLALHHCTKRTTSYLFRGYYAEDGREIKSISSAADLDKIEYLIPGSLEERKLVFACTYKADHPKRSKTTAPAPASNVQTPTSPDTKDVKPANPANASATDKTSIPAQKKSTTTAKASGEK